MKHIFDDAELAVILLFRHRKDNDGRGVYLNCRFNLPCNNCNSIPGIVYVRDGEYFVDSNEGIKPNIIHYEITNFGNACRTPEEGFKRLNIRYSVPGFLLKEAKEISRLINNKRLVVEYIRKSIPNASEKLIDIFLKFNDNDLDKTITQLKPVQYQVTRLFNKYPKINKGIILDKLKSINWDMTEIRLVEQYLTFLNNKS